MNSCGSIANMDRQETRWSHGYRQGQRETERAPCYFPHSVPLDVPCRPADRDIATQRLGFASSALLLCYLHSVKWYDGRWTLYWKGSGRKRSWHNRGIIPAFAWRDWGKPRHISVTIAHVLAEIRTQRLLNTSQERYRCVKLLGVAVWLSWRTNWQWNTPSPRLSSRTPANEVSIIPPPPEECGTAEQAAHYHILGL
jgi:hypothetical protein